MTISSRTPEGEPNHCPVCGHTLRIEPSRPPGDAPCPRCGVLAWFAPRPDPYPTLHDRWRACRKNGLPGIPRPELLRYLTAVAAALDVLSSQHSRQHLDVKPQNLFLAEERVHLIDRTGDLGSGVTPVYAAPELFEGIVTQFADQYSLAIVYVELCTGQRPFAGNNVQQLVVQHLSSPPDLSALPLIEQLIVGRALAKKPEDRYPDCATFVRTLSEVG